jgi:hypothetical protein
VVALGVARKVVPGSFCAFEFRLRALSAAGPVPEGGRLAWSCVFPMPAGQDVPPEAFLQLPQKQGFKPQVFLEGKAVVLTNATVTPDDAGGGRLSLGERATATAGEAFTGWARFQGWDPAGALARLRAHQPGPLDLDVEFQEEVVLGDWQVGAPAEEDEGRLVYPVTAGTATFHAAVSPGVEGKPLRQALDARRGKGGQPPLFGLLHYERCRLALQPLSVFGPEGPEHLTLSAEKVSMAGLLKMIKF